MISRVLFALAATTVLLGCGSESPGPRSSNGEAVSPAGASDQVRAADASSVGQSGAEDARGSVDCLARNVVLVSMDTLRADRLGLFGHERGTSPNLDALARRSLVFSQARAQSSQTAPSHASLFTSRYVGAHGVRNVHSGHAEVVSLSEGLTTLAEALRDGGVETAAFVSGGNLTRRMDMDRGFDLWDERNEDVAGRIDALLTWMFRPDRGRFFVMLHTYQVHAPYLPPRDVYPEFVDPEYDGVLRERLERYLDLPAEQAWAGGVGPDYWEGMLEYTDADVAFLSDLYDAEIRYLDGQFRRILEAVLLSELARDTVLVVLSDHGEEFKDHGKYQHDQVFEELIRVPLMVRLPGALEAEGWQGRVDVPVELVDVAPTLTELMGVGSPSGWRGRSLVRLMGPDRALETPAWADRAVFSELVVDPGPKTYWSITQGGWKYIRAHQQNIDKTWEWLFYLDHDPGEMRDLMASDDETARAWLGRLRRGLAERIKADSLESAQLSPGSRTALDDDLRAQLELLGYVDPVPSAHGQEVAEDPDGGGGR